MYPIDKNEPVNPSNYVISNIGKIEYGFPIVQSMGAFTSINTSEKIPYKLVHCFMSGGKYGTATG